VTVFLGDSGRVLLRRNGSDQIIYSVVNDSDVREDINRFSIDFAHEQVITGDRLEISTVKGDKITWIDHPDVDESFTRYVHVDEAGGIRLYETFSASLRALPSTGVPLIKPTSPQEVIFKIVNGDDERCLAEVTSYQITTTRETIDTTNLGAHYRKQYESGLIQGQGQIECFWRQPGSSCEDVDAGVYDVEFSSYLARLCIRLVHGAAFKGQFYIYANDGNDRRSVWYESDTCIVTNVAVTVSPTELVRTSIDFVTSGPIALREGYIPAFLDLEESDFNILQEDSTRGRVELENPN
jgi:hypothetical protein